MPWHVTAPAVWAVLVELTGKQVLGQWRAVHHGPGASIAVSLWVSAPIESLHTRLLMARTGMLDAHAARVRVGTVAAAREALSLSLPRRADPGRDARRVRRVVNRQLRAGSLPPTAVLAAVGWATPGQDSDRSPETILRAVVQTILRPEPSQPQQTQPQQPEPEQPEQPEPETTQTAHVEEALRPPATPEISETSDTQEIQEHESVGVRAANISDLGRPDTAPDRNSPAWPSASEHPVQQIQQPQQSRPGSRSAAGVTPSGGVRLPAVQQQARWEAAVRVVRERPQITGSELRVELAAQGWNASDRTAARILSEVRQSMLVPQA